MVVVNCSDWDPAEVLQCRALTPRLGDAQLGGLPVELSHGEHRGDFRPYSMSDSRSSCRPRLRVWGQIQKSR
jgi:hypothetical protein